MSKIRKRTKNFSDDDCMRLLDIIENHKNVIENKQTNAATNELKLNTWKNITDRYNSSVIWRRETEQLQSKYENLKNNARKYAANKRKNLIVTGGGPSEVGNNVILEKVLRIINPKTVYGESNDFDDDNLECGLTAETVTVLDNVIFEEILCNDAILTVNNDHSEELDNINKNRPENYIKNKEDKQEKMTPKLAPKFKKCNIKYKQKENLLTGLANAKEQYFKEKIKLIQETKEKHSFEEKENDLKLKILEKELETKTLVNDLLKKLIEVSDRVIQKHLL